MALPRERYNRMLEEQSGQRLDPERLELKVPPTISPGEVEVIVLYPELVEKPKHRPRRLDPHVHPAAGIWADREDIGNTVEFVSQLRRLETRRDAKLSPPPAH